MKSNKGRILSVEAGIAQDFITTLIFSLISLFPCLFHVNKFEFRSLILPIPLAIWMFLRCSRKDMSVTGYLEDCYFFLFIILGSMARPYFYLLNFCWRFTDLTWNIPYWGVS
jgi:hypothetical protein